MPLHAILFDLDGTLIDSAPDLQKATNTILAQESLPPISMGNMQLCLSDGLRKMLIRAFQLVGATLDESQLARLMPLFWQVYEEIIPEPSCIYPGVVEFLARQKARGLRMAVCSNKNEKAVRRLLKQLKLDSYFSAFVGGDTPAHCKPHPEHLLHALRLLQVTPANALMIGDHENDVLAARGAGIRVIGARYGYTHAWPAHALPDEFVDAIGDCEKLLP